MPVDHTEDTELRFQTLVQSPLRAGLLRHWAIEKMSALEREHGVHSVAFELLGPPKNSKLLFEAHLLRTAYRTPGAVRESTPEEICERLNRLIREEGRQEGEARVVLRLLRLKFGPLAPETEERVRSADADRLLEWSERVLTAERLENVFRD